MARSMLAAKAVAAIANAVDREHCEVVTTTAPADGRRAGLTGHPCEHRAIAMTGRSKVLDPDGLAAGARDRQRDAQCDRGSKAYVQPLPPVAADPERGRGHGEEQPGHRGQHAGQQRQHHDRRRLGAGAPPGTGARPGSRREHTPERRGQGDRERRAARGQLGAQRDRRPGPRPPVPSVPGAGPATTPSGNAESTVAAAIDARVPNAASR
jgi:hypothetical protein